MGLLRNRTRAFSQIRPLDVFWALWFSTGILHTLWGPSWITIALFPVVMALFVLGYRAWKRRYGDCSVRWPSWREWKTRLGLALFLVIALGTGVFLPLYFSFVDGSNHRLAELASEFRKVGGLGFLGVIWVSLSLAEAMTVRFWPKAVVNAGGLLALIALTLNWDRFSPRQVVIASLAIPAAALWLGALLAAVEAWRNRRGPRIDEQDKDAVRRALLTVLALCNANPTFLSYIIGISHQSVVEALEEMRKDGLIDRRVPILGAIIPERCTYRLAQAE